MERKRPPSYIERYSRRISGIGSNFSQNNNYAVGARVYNGASPSPHAGKGGVNPAGYQDRDNQAAVKRNLLAQMLRKGNL